MAMKSALNSFYTLDCYTIKSEQKPLLTLDGGIALSDFFVAPLGLSPSFSRSANNVVYSAWSYTPGHVTVMSGELFPGGIQFIIFLDRIIINNVQRNVNRCIHQIFL